MQKSNSKNMKENEKDYLGTKKRDRLSIVVAILEAANSGAGSAEIRSSVGLSSVLLNKYLNIVCNHGFAKFDGKTLQLTNEGLIFLSKCKKLETRYSEARTILQNLNIEQKRLISMIKEN